MLQPSAARTVCPRFGPVSRGHFRRGGPPQLAGNIVRRNMAVAEMQNGDGIRSAPVIELGERCIERGELAGRRFDFCQIGSVLELAG